MESLNLHTLANSLPTAQQNAEKELTNNFKAAALSITTLYRSSRKNSKRAYNAGYAAACQDLLTMIQQGVSLDPTTSSHGPEEGGMTIGRVMDWTEARLEAIKAREEEEDEEEEREKEKEGGKAKAPPPTAPVPKADTKPVKAPVASTSRSKDQTTSLPAAHSPRSQPHVSLPSQPSSSSPPPAAALRPIQRPIRPRLSAKGEGKGELAAPYTTPVAGSLDFIADGSPSSAALSDIPIPIAAGAKRRHAMMMMLDSSASPVTIDSASSPHASATGGGISPVSANYVSGSVSSRRRTRSSRTASQQAQNQNISLTQTAADAMDVEEDGRERKRVARR
ncbi:hypothetical protein LshimejAT787_2600620 [Lyophyllum shimeji]|uniref:Uncharacterized protein n=1 Tax=Lyophyllum shimeji TaxID=47721 RepID=A0A9P3US06_LYOSH|nr:hypothetical protein LshimejAT787_2600620 [Lyophyllum shimeji]